MTDVRQGTFQFVLSESFEDGRDPIFHHLQDMSASRETLRSFARKYGVPDSVLESIVNRLWESGEQEKKRVEEYQAMQEHTAYKEEQETQNGGRSPA